jgi:hypothetical protein
MKVSWLKQGPLDKTLLNNVSVRQTHRLAHYLRAPWDNNLIGICRVKVIALSLYLYLLDREV